MSARRTFLTLILLTLCAGLAYALQIEAEAPPDTDTRSPRPKASPMAKAARPGSPAFKLPPVRELAAVTQRPLFFEGRRPPPPPDDPPPPKQKPKGPANIALTGVIITPDSRVALIRHPTVDGVMHATEGQVIDGWKLSEIKPNQVVMMRGDRVEVVRIEDNPAPRAKKRPVRAPRRKPPARTVPRPARPARPAGR